MNLPLALVLIALILAACFERYLRSDKAKKELFSYMRERFADLEKTVTTTKVPEDLEQVLKTHELAIKNLGEQCLAEISKLKDRMGALQLKAKQELK